MSRSLFYRLGLSPEATPGTTDTNPTVYFLECSNASPALQTPKQTSSTVRRDGNLKQHVPLNRSGTFARTQDLVYPVNGEGLWREIQAGLRASTEASQVTLTNASHGTALVGTDQIDTTDSWVTQDVQKGDIVEVTNGPTTGDNGFYQVEAVESATRIRVGGGAIWSGAGTCDVKRGARMANGTTDYSFTLEECWIESPAYNQMTWTGHRVSTLALGFSMGQKSTYSVTYVGRDGSPGQMTDGGATPTPQGLSGTVTYNGYTEQDVFTPADEIVAMVGEATLPIRSFNLTTEAGARVRHSIGGGATPDAVRTGMFRARFSIETYASVLDHIADARLGTEVPIYVLMKAPDGKALGISLGTCVFDSASLPMPGMDADAMISASGLATMTVAETAASQDYDNWTAKLLRFE